MRRVKAHSERALNGDKGIKHLPDSTANIKYSLDSEISNRFEK